MYTDTVGSIVVGLRRSIRPWRGVLWLMVAACLLTAADPVASADQPWTDGLRVSGANFHPRVAEGKVPGLDDGKLLLAFGDRAVVTLYVDNGLLRDSLWFHEGGKVHNTSPLRWVVKVQKGRLIGRLRSTRGDWSYRFTCALKEKGGEGSWEWRRSGDRDKADRTGKLTASYITWAQARAQSDPIHGEQWPRWSGPRDDFTSSPQGHQLVDRIDEMKPLWRSESFLPSGLGSISRSGKGLANRDDPHGGGAAQPILADGKLYLLTFRPGQTEAQIVQEYEQKGIFQQYVKWWGQDVAARAIEHEKRRWSLDAIDELYCIDARTGQTLWRSDLGAGANWQDHKGGFNNHTACYHRGKVYAMGSTRRLYCVDAETGEVIWRTQPDRGLQEALADELRSGQTGRPFFHTSRASHTAPLVAGDTLIVPFREHVLEGRDLDTGSLRWKRGGLAERVPTIWRHKGKVRLLTFTRDRKTMVCLDLDGSIVWKMGNPVDGAFRNHGPGIQGNRFAATSLSGGDATRTVTLIGTLSDDGARVDHQVEMEGPEELRLKNFMRPILRDGKLFVSFHRPGNTYMIDLETGKVIKRLKDVHTKMNGHVQLHEEKILVLGDNHHGDNDMQLTGATPGTFVNVPRVDPPHWTTSPYTKAPWIQTYGDGRLFIRGSDGIYAYDLRKESSAKNTTPAATFTMSTRRGLAPLAITFDAGRSSDPDGDRLTLEWDFGDGAKATGSRASHRYTEPGRYEVTLTVTDARGRASHRRDTVLVGDPKVNHAPVPKVTADRFSGKLPLTVKLNAHNSWDLDGDKLAFTWTAPGGKTQNGSAATFTLRMAGRQEVKLTVTDSRGASATQTVPIRVHPQSPDSFAWEEDFADVNVGATKDTGKTPWTLKGDGRMGEKGIKVSDGQAVWTSGSIDISKMDAPGLIVAFLGSGGLEDADFCEAEYSVDGGEFVKVHRLTGLFNGGRLTRINGVAPSGEKLVIRVRMRNSSSLETYRLVRVGLYDAADQE